jgi:hypothetical protein
MARKPISRARYPHRKKQWHLPEVLDVQARHVRYAEPKLRFVGTRMVEWREAVEFVVSTAFEFPARALSPALFVGDTAIPDYEVVGKNKYLFFAFDFRGLREGAPISIGWPQFPTSKAKTRFHFKVERSARAPWS